MRLVSRYCDEKRTRHWQRCRHTKENAVYNNWTLSTVVEKRTVPRYAPICLLNGLITHFKTITLWKNADHVTRKLRTQYAIHGYIQIVDNKGISIENFSWETLFSMLQVEENNHLNDVSCRKVKDDTELSLIISPRVRIWFAYLCIYFMMKDILWWISYRRQHQFRLKLTYDTRPQAVQIKI